MDVLIDLIKRVDVLNDYGEETLKEAAWLDYGEETLKEAAWLV